MNPPLRDVVSTAALVELIIDGRAVTARAGETLIELAQREGVAIPHLCWTPGLAPAGNCRACMVEIDGERVLAASCCRVASAGMVVASASARARHAQKMVLELLLADTEAAAAQPLKRDSELDHWALRLEVGR